jgi:photosystem II stability/assembly factor-like uncharacterized protein
MIHKLFFLIASILLIACKGPTDSKMQKNSPYSRNDTWGYVGYGGGGAMFNPAVSPHNPDYTFVSCDMTGSYVTYNGGESWRMFCLRSPVRYYTFDPLDSNTVYANSIGLFRSRDRGNTWHLIYPNPAEVIQLVSKGDHATEVLVTKDSTRRSVLAFNIDPENSRKLYAAISIDHATAFYTSENTGEDWIKEKELTDRIRNIYIDPYSPKDSRTIYFTGINSIIVREGGNWKTNKGPDGVAFLTEFAGGSDQIKKKFILYAISGLSYFNPEGDKSGIYYTEDGGKNWENRQNGLLGFHFDKSDLPEWRSIATCASHPEIVYVSYNNLKVHDDTVCLGVAISNDYGLTWKLSWKDRLTKEGNSPSENYKSGWINDRFGPTWGENPFSLGVSPDNPDVCYGTDFGRTTKTTNRGTTWEQVYTRKKPGGGWISRGLEVTTGYTIVFDPFDLNHVFIANTDVGLMESNDGGESWFSATRDNGIPRNWVNSTYWLTFDPDVQGKAWAVMSSVHDLPRPKMWRRRGITGFDGGIMVTENGGKSWQPVSKDIGEAAMTHILVDPASTKESRTLYACAFGKGVYKSVDGGLTWKQKNSGIEGKEPFAWRITCRDQDGTLFLIISRRSEDGSIGNELDGAIYRSNDAAESWSKIKLPAETNAPTSLLVDPANPRHLILSAWGRNMEGQFTPDIGGGIFSSFDDGLTWKQTLEKDQHIHDITYDSRNKTFFACGFNGSAYRSEDKGETWMRIKGYNFKWGKRVEPDPGDPEKIFIITFGGGVWYGPAKGDPNAVEDIVTPVIAY